MVTCPRSLFLPVWHSVACLKQVALRSGELCMTSIYSIRIGSGKIRVKLYSWMSALLSLALGSVKNGFLEYAC